MRRVLAIVLSLMMIVAFTSCKGGASTSSNDDVMIVTISIDFPDNSGVADVTDCNLEVMSGSSVLDVLNAYVDGYNGEVAMDETSSTPYVVAINGVIATDASGWVYKVNDKEIVQSADEYEVNDGDNVRWTFETWGV